VHKLRDVALYFLGLIKPETGVNIKMPEYWRKLKQKQKTDCWPHRAETKLKNNKIFLSKKSVALR
jgi:hypothetical protein